MATYVADAIALPPEFDTVYVYEDKTERTSAVLLREPSQLLADADRGAAIGSLVLRGIFRSPDPRDLEVKLTEELDAISTARNRAAQGAPFLVVIVEHDVDPDLRTPLAEQGGYSVFFNAVDKAQVRAVARPKADRVLAAAIVASDTEPRFDRLDESIYLINQDSGLIYSLRFTGRASLTVRHPSPELPDAIARYASASRKKGRPDLATVYSLLRAAVDRKTEPLKAFLSAWSALEIFTNKVFPTYEGMWFDDLTGGRSEPTLKHLSRMREVMKGKYALLDRFTVVSVMLAPAEADSDVAAFGRLKKQRDHLFHGGALNESDLPAHGALTLARKYIRLHLDTLR